MTGHTNIVEEALRYRRVVDAPWDGTGVRPRVRVHLPYKGYFLVVMFTNKKYPERLGRTLQVGGGVEPGENARAAAVRELGEELSYYASEVDLEFIGVDLGGVFGPEIHFTLHEHNVTPGVYSEEEPGVHTVLVMEAPGSPVSIRQPVLVYPDM